MDNSSNTFKAIINRIPGDSQEIKRNLITELGFNKDLINNYYSGRTKTIPHTTCVTIHLYLCKKYNPIMGNKPITLDEWIMPFKNNAELVQDFANLN